MTRVADAVTMFERRGIVFDKWPQPDGWEWDTLDTETRWQAVAFMLYTMLIEAETRTLPPDGRVVACEA